MNRRAIPELSIIVPTYNESATLPALLASLDKQRGVDFELILVDGGSQDTTRNLAKAFAADAGFPVTLIESAAGRGRQLNAGAVRARGASLLFLHADSSFADPHALADGLFFFDHMIDSRGDDAVAGHFSLCFLRSRAGSSAGYAFYESKARLNRRGCIHGDQGFLVRRSFFERLGPFATSLPFLEDERFADAVSGCGEWVLLPAEILTSARRFEKEGLLSRQILNALIMNAAAIGWTSFLHQAPDLYRRQGEAGRLELLPFFRRLKRLLQDMSWQERACTWYRSGAYVRDNGWQLLLAVDFLLGWRRNHSWRGEETPVLDRYERWYDRFSNHPGGRCLAAGAVWAWFHVTWGGLELLQRLQFFRKEEGEHVADRD
ncbi:TIGR04283 family arsenosugar biosynthesis glycosyltransferase [Trichloromonas sp.]|uniref:TIGR04283 family arsenosugar biosynthesis glycosyltransferase n=1 Tax=Trichloromonas sp. TaxID=3069249 RepID=UPI003D81A431